MNGVSNSIRFNCLRYWKVYSGVRGQWHIFQINKIMMNVILEQWSGKEEGGGVGGGV